MPKLSQQVQTTVTAKSEVKLSPALRLKLQKRLKIAKELKVAYDAAKAAFEREKMVLGGLREQAGEQSLTLEGFGTITEVRGTSKKLDKKKFVAMGGSLAMLEGATTEKPKKAYELVTFPGDDDESDDKD